jgi:CRP-like cAMP-binding protein
MIWDEEEALARYDNEAWSIWAELAQILRLWRSTYRDYWGLNREIQPGDPNEAELIRWQHDDVLAAKLLLIAQALSANAVTQERAEKPRIGSDEFLRWLRELLRQKGKSPIVQDRIGLDLATDAVHQLHGATDRALKLLGIIHDQGLSGRAAEFISRATRLYIWGFEPESIIMCRAALEGALLLRLEDYYDLDGKPPSLDTLIGMAGDLGILAGYERLGQDKWRARSGTPLWRAQRIKWSGNYAAHHAPAVRQEQQDLRNAFEAVRDLSIVLAKLFSAAGHA